jgi:hypothetical protein
LSIPVDSTFVGYVATASRAVVAAVVVVRVVELKVVKKVSVAIIEDVDVVVRVCWRYPEQNADADCLSFEDNRRRTMSSRLQTERSSKVPSSLAETSLPIGSPLTLRGGLAAETAQPASARMERTVVFIVMTN